MNNGVPSAQPDSEKPKTPRAQYEASFRAAKAQLETHPFGKALLEACKSITVQAVDFSVHPGKNTTFQFQNNPRLLDTAVAVIEEAKTKGPEAIQKAFERIQSDLSVFLHDIIREFLYSQSAIKTLTPGNPTKPELYFGELWRDFDEPGQNDALIKTVCERTGIIFPPPNLGIRMKTKEEVQDVLEN